ncbi:MAG: hypothetical protein JSW70_03475, partial [Syntrophobacterales bacterium]
MNIKHFIVAIFTTVLICMGQGFWYVSYTQEKAESIATEVRIKEEKGPAGHKTIGIDEESLDLDAVKEVPLTFSTLMTWDYRIGDNPSPPDDIRKLDGRKVRLTG